MANPTPESTARLDAESDPGDVLIVREQGEYGHRFKAIWHDDTAERSGDAAEGEHWYDAEDNDPMDLYQHIKDAVDVMVAGRVVLS